MRYQPQITKHDDEIDRFSRPPIHSASRRKGTGVRAWLLLDSAGEAQVLEAGKHAIMRRTGLPARDLRILDPQLSYPSTILGRERAIVVNLEQIKAVITAQEVLLMNSGDPMVTPVVEELQRRLVCHYNATKAREGNAEVLQRGSDKEFLADVSCFWGLDEQVMVDRKPSLEHQGGPNVLPFEFVALEAFLEATCSSLDKETKTLEQEAHPALDKLTSKISTLNLDRVRQLKSRFVALTGRVQKVRDELEHLLDDDEDMAEMYLTEKQQLENSSTSSLNGRAEMSDEYLQGDFDSSIPGEASLDPNKASSSFDFEIQNTDNSKDYDSHRTHTTTRSSVSNKLDVEELEMLLEAYFVQIEGTLNKLSTLREYVDDTEDYINIMLDDKQNHLLQMGVMLTTATLVISSFIVVAGIFGMNINIAIFNEEVETAMPKFLWTVGGSSIGCVVFYVFAIAWYKKKRLID